MQRAIKAAGQLRLRHMEVTCDRGEVFLVHNARDLFPSPGLYVVDAIEPGEPVYMAGTMVSAPGPVLKTPYLVIHMEAYTHAILINDAMRERLLAWTTKDHVVHIDG